MYQGLNERLRGGNWYLGQNERFIGSRDELSEDIVWRRSLLEKICT